MSRRLPLLALGGVALLSAGWGGLARIGVLPAVPAGGAATEHGALMVSGFVGTLIALERAIVVRRWWAEVAPALSAAGALGVLVGVPAPLPALAIAAGALVLVAVQLTGGVGSPGLAMTLMATGALAWAAGSSLWAASAGAPHRMVPWWMAFLVLTIAAERMELSRALRPSRAALAVFASASGVFALGVAATLVDFASGIRIAGAGLVVLAVWLALRDRAPAASRALPLPRFIATAIALSYVWLAVGAALMTTYDGVPAGWRYDAMVHAVFVGGVLSMIFAHAPIVLPSIAGVAFAYRPALYAPLALLQLSLLARVAGDLLARAEWRDWGGLLNGVAVVAFMATMASGIRRRRAESRAALAAARRS